MSETLYAIDQRGWRIDYLGLTRVKSLPTPDTIAIVLDGGEFEIYGLRTPDALDQLKEYLSEWRDNAIIAGVYQDGSKPENLRLATELHAAQAEIERLRQVINDASLGLEFTMQERFSGNLDEWEQSTKVQLTTIMGGLDEVFNKE